MKNLLEKCTDIQSLFTGVSIDQNKLEEFARSIDPTKVNLSEITLGNHGWEVDDSLQLLTLFNSMNFTFWCNKDEPKWTITLDGKEYDGSTALFKALEQEAILNPSILNADSWVKLTKIELGRILKGNIEIPMIEERVQLTNETGRILLEKYEGSVRRMVISNNFDTVELLKDLELNFPSYQDTQRFNDVDLPFLKRAQLHVRMISDTLKGEGDSLKNLDKLTAFADYKVPQILRRLGILVYSRNLASIIDNFETVPKDSREEVEIRASTIIAVELIKECLEDENLTASHVDSLLWIKSQEKNRDEKPYHRTTTTSY
jgi:hypothetical protein